jgi:ankyrin repeat protein
LQWLIESFKPFDPGLGSLVSFLGGGRKNNDANPILSVIDSVLPNSALTRETLASGVAIEKLDQISSIEFLNLTAFLISNNFPAESNGKEIYEWLKTHGKSSLNVLQSMKGPSAEALLENLFRLAVEAEDIPIVKDLLRTGVDPNGSSCTLKFCPVPLTPLQFACLKGNTELAQELVKAGSSIDEPGSGWKSSALTLAIFGHTGLSEGVDDVDASEDSDDWNNQEGENGDDNDLENGTNHLIDLVNCLISAGASVTLEDSDSYMETESLQKWKCDLRPGCLMYPLVHEGHSALTAASKYRHKEVVDLLIQYGADVRLLMKNDNSALRECLYCSEERAIECEDEEIVLPKALFERPAYFQGSNRRSRIIGIVRSLIDAGADLNDHVPCNDSDFCDHYFFECYSPLDLAVLIGSMELIEMMLCAGAHATKRSLDSAIQVRSFEIFNRLLNAGAPIPDWATSETDELTCPFPPTSAGLVSTDFEDLQRKRAAIIAAIRLGETTALDDLMRSLDGYSGNILDNCPGLTGAIEDCCYDGHFEVLCRLLSGRIIDQSALALFFGCSVYNAIQNNQEKLVDMLLKAGADINTGSEDSTPLLLAIQRQNWRLVRKLLHAGANLNKKCNCWNHERFGDVLVAAIEKGCEAVIKDIIRAGADIDALGQMSWNWTALLYQDSQLDCWCCSPLTMAILKKNWAMVHWLLGAGAAVNYAPGKVGRVTPLWAAVIHKNIVLVRSLLEAGARTDDIFALEEAAGDIELLKLLVAKLGVDSNRGHPNNVGRLALDKAIKQKSIATARFILKSGLVNVNALEKGSSPLHQALVCDVDHRLELTKLLLRSGADPNRIVYKTYETIRCALPDAINTQDPRTVQLLLEEGSKVIGSFEEGIHSSPVQLAAQKGSIAILRILLKNGSNSNDVSPRGMCGAAIQLATENRNLEMVRDLLKHNANPNMVTRGLPHTALQIAAREGCKEIVELLLEYGADMNSPPAEKFGATALQFAAIGGYLGIALLLLEKGADVNAPPAKTEGRTALEGAAEHGRIDMVQLLINAGADISEAGHGQYERALMRASKNGHHATWRLLQSYLKGSC